MIRVQGDGGNDYKTATVQAFIVNPEVEGDAKCTGFVTSFYGNPAYTGTCDIPPYGNGLFLDGTLDLGDTSSQVWTIRLVDEQKGAFELIATNKPDRCLRFLAASGCGSQTGLVKSASDGNGQYTSWKLVKRYDIVPDTQPPPPPAATPTVPSPTIPSAIPGPIISGPSSSNTGYVDVAVTFNGGNSECSVESIIITSSSNTAPLLTKTVEVPVSTPGLNSVGIQVTLVNAGYNSIYAAGKCSGGSLVTEISNGLSVFWVLPPSPPPPPPPSPPPPPPAITFNGTSNIAVTGSTAFVTNNIGGFVSSCTIQGKSLIGCFDAGGNGLQNIVGIAVSDSTAFVVNDGLAVRSCTISGQALSGCTDTGNGFDYPSGIIISGSTAFVSSTNGGYISSCDITGSSTHYNLTDCKSAASGFNRPQALAVSPTALFFVSNGLTIGSCTRSGATLSNCVSEVGNAYTKPLGIAVSGNALFAANRGNNTITACTIAGTNLTSCADSGASGFNYPWGITVDGTNVFVANFLGNSVSGCTSSGSSIGGCQESF